MSQSHTPSPAQLLDAEAARLDGGRSPKGLTGLAVNTLAESALKSALLSAAAADDAYANKVFGPLAYLSICSLDDTEAVVSWNCQSSRAWHQFFARHLGKSHPAMPTLIAGHEQSAEGLVLVLRLRNAGPRELCEALKNTFPTLYFVADWA